ncbi:helix-turn-helix domain-containing protein [Actinacidiphila yeochonensis]|uniref:helix-turn-helix domain-containing protein n=1 Tax=Actinacidiphila yeochonensis TaxID=89050 RepID=UPI00068C3047|nr:helix-turn-helix transcriptional regulator [Actinacidiphila yeochonensis]
MASTRKPRQSPGKKNSTPYQQLGKLLAHYRVRATYTQVQLACLLHISQAKLESIEQGRRPLGLELAEELDQCLKTGGALVVMVVNLPERDAIAPWAEEFVNLEREAIAMSSYENQVVPGLLQTEGYMRAVFSNEIPQLTPDDRELRVTKRMERQELLRREVPPVASFVISEAALRDQLGGSEVFREQVRHLRECADLPGITIQILRLGRTTHAALSGPFVVLETQEHEQYAYAETPRGSHLIHDPDEVCILTYMYAMLRSQALTPEDTKGLLDELLGE